MNPDTETDLITITAEEAGKRLDKILSKRYSDVQSRTYFQSLIANGEVLLNGGTLKKRFQPKEGDVVEVHFVLTPEIELTPEPIPLDILYEDDALLVVNKPVGMVVHPAPGNWTGTFVNALLHHCKELRGGESLRPGIVHRLDKDTSGILLAAKTVQAQQRLVAQFSERKVYKEYLAVCVGNPGEALIDAPIGRHQVHRKKMTIREEGGREARTFCKVRAFDGKLSVVKVEIETGRTHQIRVHLKHRGTPVLGDEVYGNPQANEKYGVHRQLLHAHIVRLKHPLTGVDLELIAKMPDGMRHWVEKIESRGK